MRRWGSPAQQERFLASLAGGTLGAYALSEAGSGSDAFALQCRAEPDGDDFVVNRRKPWITNGEEAGFYLIFASVDPSAGHRGITCFVVERDMEGFAIPRKEDKLGIRASSTWRCSGRFDTAWRAAPRVRRTLRRFIQLETIATSLLGEGL